jgi:hypothetical protein
VLAAVALVVPVVLLSPGTSTAAPAPTATQIVVTGVSSPGIDVPVAPGTPASFVAVGHDVTVDVELRGKDEAGNFGPLPASYNKDTVLRIAVGTGSASLDGKRTTSVVVAAGATSASFEGVQFKSAGNEVTLEVSGPAGRGKRASTLTPGSSDSLDVQSEFITAAGTSTLTSIGPGGGVGTECSPDRQHPVCAELVLPNGSTSGQLLSLGECVGNGSATDCPTDRSVVQALAALDETVYTESNPAVLRMKCDKSSCGGGAIKSKELVVNLAAKGNLTPAPACPAKGTVGHGQEYCVDYVQSTRDNAGDTILYLLFVKDGRASFR